MSKLYIECNQLIDGEIKLVKFEEKHISLLCDKAQDSRIWKHHHINFHDPDVFLNIAIEKAKRDIMNNSRYMFVIYLGGEVIGSTSYYQINLKHKKLSIGYSWLHPDYWGKGINTKVKNLLFKYGFEELKLKRISFHIDSENSRSRGAVEKLKVPFEGILKNHQIRPDNTSRDTALYAITDKQWKETIS